MWYIRSLSGVTSLMYRGFFEPSSNNSILAFCIIPSNVSLPRESAHRFDMTLKASFTRLPSAPLKNFPSGLKNVDRVAPPSGSSLANSYNSFIILPIFIVVFSFSARASSPLNPRLARLLNRATLFIITVSKCEEVKADRFSSTRYCFKFSARFARPLFMRVRRSFL